MQEVDQVIQGH